VDFEPEPSSIGLEWKPAVCRLVVLLRIVIRRPAAAEILE